MRIVLDTNVVFSAYLWGGKPAEILNRAGSGHLTVVTSFDLLGELRRVLRYPQAIKRRAVIGGLAARLFAARDHDTRISGFVYFSGIQIDMKGHLWKFLK